MAIAQESRDRLEEIRREGVILTERLASGEIGEEEHAAAIRSLADEVESIDGSLPAPAPIPCGRLASAVRAFCDAYLTYGE